MTIADQLGHPVLDLFRDLSTQSPVDRALVHRAAVMEVFATDCAERGDDRYAVAVQLPRAHTYYNDHLTRPELIDPLLLLECCRQAVTVVAHRYLGVPFGTSFLISGWTTTFTGGEALVVRGDAPDELVLAVTARGLRRRGDRLLAATFDTGFHRADGQLAGTSTVHAGYLSRDGHQGYRELRRDTPPPMSGDMPLGRPGVPVAPGAVGRGRPDNVVLVDARRSPGRVEALVDVPVRHPAMYDHPLDHVPAMALLEAARQAAVLAVDEEAADQLYATAFDAEFSRFVELDAPTAVTAEVRGGGGRVAVDFRQDGESACAVEVAVVGLGERR